jgi:hypothetical protein
LENYTPISFIQDNYPLKSIFKLFIIDFVRFVHRSMASFSLGNLPIWVFFPNGKSKNDDDFMGSKLKGGVHCNRAEIRPCDILCPMDIFEKEAKCGSRMVITLIPGA